MPLKNSMKKNGKLILGYRGTHKFPRNPHPIGPNEPGAESKRRYPEIERPHRSENEPNNDRCDDNEDAFARTLRFELSGIISAQISHGGLPRT